MSKNITQANVDDVRLAGEFVRVMAKHSEMNFSHAWCFANRLLAVADNMQVMIGDVPREIDKPVEPATPEPCPTPTKHSS